MDHHQHHNHRFHHPDYLDSRYLPPPRHLPPPPPPPPHIPSILHHHHAPPPPPPHRHHEVNFVNSPPPPPPHHHHHLLHRRQLLIDDDHHLPLDSPRVYNHPHHLRDQYDDDRRRFDPPRVPPPNSMIDWDRAINSVRMSPPFVEFDRFKPNLDRDPHSPSRFRDDFDTDRPVLLRLHPDDELRSWRRDDLYHEEYCPEAVFRRELVDDVVVRDDRRVGGLRDLSRSPIRLRSRGVDGEDDDSTGFREFCEGGMNRGPEHGRFVDRACSRAPRKVVQKKSALLRLQPLKHTSFRNKHDTTPSAVVKGKESLEGLERRVSEERVGSPVELDVSFKSNALVAKAIVSDSLIASKDPKEGSVVSDLDTRIEGENSSKSEMVKKSGSISSASRKVSENRVRVSPITRRVGLSSNVEVHNSNSGSPPSGCGGTTRRESPKSEFLEKDSVSAGSDKVSSPNVRKKRKSIISLSRLSNSVRTDKDARLLEVDDSAKGSTESGYDIEQLGKGLSSRDQVSKTIQYDMDNEKVDVNGSPVLVAQDDVPGPSNFEVSFSRRIRTRGRLVFRSDSPVPTASDSPGNNAQDARGSPFEDENATISGEKLTSDIGTERGSSQRQDVIPLLANDGCGKGFSEPMSSTGGNIDNIDIQCGNEVNCIAVTSSDSIPDISVKTQNRVESTRSFDVDKLCGTGTTLSPERVMVEQSCGNGHLDTTNKDTELNNSGDLTNLGSFSNIDLCSDKTSSASGYDDVVTVDSEKMTAASDIKATSDSQEQQCPTSVSDDTGEGSPKSYVSMEDDLSLVSAKEGISVPSRKRKAENNLDSLDSVISETNRVGVMALSLPIEDEDPYLPVEKLVSADSGLPCCIAESDVQRGSESGESYQEGVTSMNYGPDSDPIEHPSRCKKQKTVLGSALSDASVSEYCGSTGLTPSAHILTSISEALSNSVTYLPKSVEGIRLSISDQNIVGEATKLPTKDGCAGSSKSEFSSRNLCLSVPRSGPLYEKPSRCLSESGLQQTENVDIVMDEASDASKSILSESEGKICTYQQNDDPQNICGDSDRGLLVIGMECENNIVANDNMVSVSECKQSCAEPTYDRVDTNSDMLDPPSTVGFSGASSAPTPVLDISDSVPALNSMSKEKLGSSDKISNEHLLTQGSHSNTRLQRNEITLKSGISAAAGDQPVARKRVSVPSKNAVNMIPRNAMRRLGRNVLTRANASFSPVHVSSALIHSKKAPSTYPAKPRTWCRTDNHSASNIVANKPFAGAAPVNPPINHRSVKVQGTSYVRKGNSLVRNPASVAAVQGPRASVNQSNTNDPNIVKKQDSPVMVDSAVTSVCLMSGGQNTPIEMPKTPPLSCSGEASNCDIVNSVHGRSLPLAGLSEGIDSKEAPKSSETALISSRNPETVVERNLEDMGAVSDGNLPVTNSKRIVYVKRKSNQLIAASNPSEPSVCKRDKTPALSSDNNYYKRRKHQLIRASSESNIQQMVAAIDNNSKSQPQRVLNVYSGRSSNKRPSSKVKHPKGSLVWKLGDAKPSGKVGDLLRSGKIISHLLPWKRATYRRSVWRSSTNWSHGASLMKKKLLSSKKRATIYVRSGRGFSLRRSKVISLGGSSLKWSKSMEKRSKKVNEEAATTVAAMDSVERRKTGPGVVSGAESTNNSSFKPVHSLKLNPGERIFRIGVFRYRMDPSRRALQRIPDEEPSDAAASKAGKDARKTYVPKRLLIGTDEYVRIGNGNQLVRDPKRRTRILASEKVRWSLHTARTRLAKKRKFCQFFTRFGKCNKGEGKCPFIHDPSKIAVCTKFLNGLCGDASCKLTHEVIPERMPDCSFFLQGLCSNENCPYRHVNVNPKASICESFLRGYCAEGNECRKKHSYICPEFEASGSCPRGPKCKLYHPKKGGSKGNKRRSSKDQRNGRGRYFGSGITTVVEPWLAVTAEKQVGPKNDNSVLQEGELGDYISLDVSDDEVEEDSDRISKPMSLFEVGDSKSQSEDLDELIKPVRIMDRH